MACRDVFGILALTLSMFLCSVAKAQNQPLSFKGLTPGVTTQDQLVERLGIECKEPRNAVSECSGSEDGGFYLATFYKGMLASLYFSFEHDMWSSFSEGFRSKYGKPGYSVTRVYQNRMGAKFTGRVMHWSKGTESLLLTEYADQLDKSCILLRDTRLSDIVTKIEEKTQRKSNRALVDE